MKSKFLVICLSLLVVFSGLTLVACGEDSSSTNPYSSYDATLQAMETNSSLFKEDATSYGGVESKFCLNNFYTKNLAGVKTEGNRYIIFFVAYGLNYIDKYYTYLSGLTGYNFSSLNNSIDELNSILVSIDRASENMIIADNSSNTSVYNSYYATYEAQAKTFINSIFNNAVSLADFLIEERELAKELGTYNQTFSQITFYVETQILYAIDDAMEIIINNAQGQALAGNDVYDGTVRLITNFSNLAVSGSFITSLDADTMAETIKLSNYLANERETTVKAYQNVSLISYVEDENILSQGNSLAYYRQLQKYYVDNNSYLYQYYLYLANNIYEM